MMKQLSAPLLQKCVLYWPERRGIYGRVEVLVQGVRECEHYTRRSLTLQCGGRSSTLQHYWYTSWPDHKTPDSTLPLLQLMADVEAERQASASRGPVIVHCRYTHTPATFHSVCHQPIRWQYFPDLPRGIVSLAPHCFTSLCP